MAQTRAKKREKAGEAADLTTSTNAATRHFAAEVGRLVRRSRARRGITRRQLAVESGISERYLAQIEGGEGNPSVIVLRAIAQAMDMHVTALLPAGEQQNEALVHINELLGRFDPSELPSIAQLLDQRIREGAASERAQRIALVGLRGAGKTTLGQMLAKRLNWPFVEINRVIEQDYGASVSTLIDMSGVSAFRRYERAALERVIAEHEKVVIATAGGIVSNPDSYALLLRRAHTVWVKAAPQEHMRRVIAQGDFRPMAENRAAMADLVAILEARGADYAQAQVELDTSGDKPEQSLSRLTKLVQEWT